MAGRHHGEPRKRIGIFAGREHVEGAFEPGLRVGELRGKFLHNLRTDFITTLADAGADGGENVSGLSREFHLHTAERLCSNARNRAAPSGMDGSDGAMTRVNEQDGDTVGGLDGEE